MELLPGFTNPEEEQAYIERIRKMSDSEKLTIAFQLMQDAIDAAKVEILKEFPDESEEERKLIFVDRMYGKDLADRVRAYLQKQAAMNGSDDDV
jgi:serine kinase of HPr protein (carbohydrate metabolism regulator)